MRPNSKLFINFLRQFNPESEIKFKFLPEEVQVEIILAWEDVYKAAATAVIIHGIVVDPSVAVFAEAFIIPAMTEFLRDRKTPFVLKINKKRVLLTSKIALGVGVACIAGVGLIKAPVLTSTSVLVAGSVLLLSRKTKLEMEAIDFRWEPV